MTTAAMVRLEGLSKSFDELTVLDRIDLDIEQGEFLTLLGPSGCGKTTTLRLIAGFETASAGSVNICGREMTSVPPHKRPVNTVFQNYALFPHMTVGENVAFGLQFDGVGKAARLKGACEMLERVGLADKFDQRPDRLSGGQKQRVALARALIKKPSVLLLDEPLSALDAALRKRLQLELKDIQRETGVTFVYVTHDQEEALTLSDRIVVMEGGHIRQCGTPLTIYQEPADLFVARFVGQSSLVKARVVGTPAADRVNIELADGQIVKLAPRARSDLAPNQSIDLILRPESLRLAEPTDKEQGRVFQARVTNDIFVGDRRRLLATLGNGQSVELTVPNSAPVHTPSTEIGIAILDDAVHAFNAIAKAQAQ
tara:strand:+ start:2158 stop:3267 length:1110 start_codon:yes stop_codon:yes gene_type:complete